MCCRWCHCFFHNLPFPLSYSFTPFTHPLPPPSLLPSSSLSFTFLLLSAERIGGISTNFQLGFGSFVDKKLGPFANLDPIRYIVLQLWVEDLYQWYMTAKCCLRINPLFQYTGSHFHLMQLSHVVAPEQINYGTVPSYCTEYCKFESFFFVSSALRLVDPCFPGNCQPPYSYHHVVSLTEDNEVFQVWGYCSLLYLVNKK